MKKIALAALGGTLAGTILTTQIAGPLIAPSKWLIMPPLTRGSRKTGTLPTGALPGLRRATARVPARVP